MATALTYGTLGFLLFLAGVGLPRYLVTRDGRQMIREAAVALYGCLLLAVVLMPGPDQEFQLVPFQWTADVARELHHHDYIWATPAWRGMCLNIALFVPLGLLSRHLPRHKAVWLGFAASLTIEITQVTFVHRIFDVDDLMTNTTGTLIGWTIAAAVAKVQLTALKTSSTTAAT